MDWTDMTILLYVSRLKAPVTTVTKTTITKQRILGEAVGLQNNNQCLFVPTLWNPKVEHNPAFVVACAEYVYDKYTEKHLRWAKLILIYLEVNNKI